jgi:hypothetical protein
MKIENCAPAILFAVLLIPLQLAGCEEAKPNPRDASSTDALLMAKAEATSSAVSALKSLDSGDVKVARSTLEVQLVGGLTVLKAMKSEKTSASKEMIDSAIAEAEEYARAHNLSVPAPPAKN